MISQLLTRDPLLGQLPAEVEDQVQEILARILKLAGYSQNSNTDSNSVGGIRIPAIIVIIMVVTFCIVKLLPLPEMTRGGTAPLWLDRRG